MYIILYIFLSYPGRFLRLLSGIAVENKVSGQQGLGNRVGCGTQGWWRQEYKVWHLKVHTCSFGIVSEWAGAILGVVLGRIVQI